MINSYKKYSRRKFTTTITSAGAAFFLYPLSSFAMNIEEDPRIAKIVSNSIGIDTHNHMDVPFLKEDFKNQKYDLKEELNKSGLSAICLTFCVDRPKLNNKGYAYERFIIILDELDELLKSNNINRALNFTDIKTAHKEKHPIVIQSVEGGHFIEDKIERLELAYNRGVRHLGLLHDNPSYTPLGDIYTDPPKYNGLTEMGINTIKECNRLGILVDLTHCSNKGINDAIKVSNKPIIISHTGLNTQLGNNEKMAKMMLPRLISKEQAKIVASAGGILGVWTHLSESPTEYAQNILAMVEVAGIDHVCIGTDTKIAPSSNDKFGGKTNQAWENTKQGFYYTLVKSLLDIGFKEDEIAKIGGGNYFRVFDIATKKS
jgi:membrane dipeptidase